LCREFSYEIDTGDGQTTYVRYQAYENAQTFRKALGEMNPNKIDIGGIYPTEVSYTCVFWCVLSDARCAKDPQN
jgi:hypothetical protein